MQLLFILWVIYYDSKLDIVGIADKFLFDTEIVTRFVKFLTKDFDERCNDPKQSLKFGAKLTPIISREAECILLNLNCFFLCWPDSVDVRQPVDRDEGIERVVEWDGRIFKQSFKFLFLLCVKSTSLQRCHYSGYVNLVLWGENINVKMVNISADFNY